MRRVAESPALAALAALLVAISSCDRSSPPAPAPAPSVTTSAPNASPAPAPSTAVSAVESPPAFVALAITGYGDAVVSVPAGSLSPRPVVVVAHGLDDRPEGQCDVWRGIVDGRAFVLCPRGIPVPNSQYSGFSYNGAEALAFEIDAALAALRARFGARIAEGPVLYAGFSLGANLGVHVVERSPARFPVVVLTEGGEDAWTTFDAKQFHARGGRRVLFVCALAVHVPTASVSASRLEAAGVGSRVVLAKLPGKPEFMHWYNGPVVDEIRGQLDWLVEGDTRWAP